MSGILAFELESKMQVVDEEALDTIVLAAVIHDEDMAVCVGLPRALEVIQC